MAFENSILKEVSTSEARFKLKHYNLSREEMKALEDLRQNASIVIKPADKEGGIVILNIIDYGSEIFGN